MITQRTALLGKQFARFVISGGLAALVGLASVYFLTEFFGINYLFSSSATFALVFIVAFCLQKFWSFQNRELTVVPLQISLSMMLAGINFFLNGGLMYLLVAFFHLQYAVAQMCTYLVLGLIDFFIYKRVIFKTM